MELAADRTYGAEVSEQVGTGVVALYLEDPEGEPDRLIKGVTDHRVQDGGVYQLNAVALARGTVADWSTDPRPARRDLEAEGMMVLLYVDPDGRPLAGVNPDLGQCGRMGLPGRQGPAARRAGGSGPGGGALRVRSTPDGRPRHQQQGHRAGTAARAPDPRGLIPGKSCPGRGRLECD